MKLWDKGYDTNAIINQFTVGNDRELDLRLAKYDILGSIAHSKMLESIGLLSKDELKEITLGLEKLLQSAENGDFKIEEAFEDVHSKVEFELTQMIGEAGKKIHSARSRNDQVLVDLHLYLKDEIKSIQKKIDHLFDILLKRAEETRSILIPGYTHMQVAMPSSFGMWFSAYAEQLIDDQIQFEASYKISDQNPLGSAAGYGSSFPIDRKMTTDLLDFTQLKVNSVAAQMNRGKLEKSMAFSISAIASTLNKLSMDICLFVSQNFDFIKLPKEYTTGSSIMPHKQNPDVFELIRGETSLLQSLPMEIALLTNNLSSGYHRDFQLLKENLFGGIDKIKELLDIVIHVIPEIEVNEDILDDSMYDFVFSVEELNKKVLSGMSFRDAYKELGKSILEGNFSPSKTIQHSHIGSIGNLSLEMIRLKKEELLQ